MRITLLITLSFWALFSQAQLNRYPYIQSTTKSSTIIAWKTANDVIGKVAFGVDSTNLNDTIFETAATKRHALTLSGLEKDTKYYYAIYSGNTLEAGEHFFTASDSTDQEFSFIHYGDCGYNSGVQKTIGSLMEADDASFAVVCGDVDQGGVPHISGSQGGDDYDEVFFDVYNNGTTHKMLSKECHYTAIGNHDTYADNGATYELEFHLPHNNPANSERYYSFEWGDAKFIALDVITPFDPTTFPINQLPNSQRWWTDFRQGSPQYEFLVDELQCNDKKWVFVYFHEGPWTNYWGADYNLPNALGGDYYQYEGNTMVRQHLVPVFEQYNVDFVLVGHSHLYEQAEKNGVWYITSGGAGDVGGNTQYGNNPEILKSIIDNLYVKFSVDSNTVSYDVINASNTVIDTFSLTKPYSKYEVIPTISNVTCFGGNDGSIDLNIQGPKGPYTVEWFDGSTGTSRTNLSKGTYFAYIRNAYSCEKVSSFVVEEPAQLEANIISSTGSFTFCEGDSVELFVDSSFANYSWSNGKSGPSIFISQAGPISVATSSINGCGAVSPVIQVTQTDNPSANFGYANNDEEFNFLCSDLNVNTYYWDFGDGTLDTTTTNTSNHSYTMNSNYNVILVTVNNCGNDTVNKVVTVNSFPPDTTGISNLYIQDALSIIPNPFHESARVEVVGLGQNLEVQVFNLVGELVLSESKMKSSFTIENKNLSTGTYYLKIVNPAGRFSYAKIMID